MFGPQEQGVRLLVMYPATLIILSEESDGLFYKVTEVPHCTHKREKLNLMSLNPPFGRKEKD